MTMIIGMNHNLVPGLSIKEVERFGGSVCLLDGDHRLPGA